MQRKYVVRAVIGLVVLLVLWLGIGYLTTGKVVVTTNSSENTVTIAKIDASNGQKPSATGTGNLSARLRPGKYLVKVSSRSFASTKVVQVKARETTEYNINPVKLSALEPVLPSGGNSIAASSSSLFYVEPGSKLLYSIDAQNNSQPVDTTHQFTNIKWADQSYGVGLGDNNQFYIISDGVARQLSLPFSNNNDKAQALTYSISSDRHIFIGRGKSIYGGTESGGFKQILTARTPTPSLQAWGSKVAVLEVAGDVTNTNLKSSVTIVSSSGSILATAPFDADSGAWSADGKYLALFSESSEGKVVDSSLHVVSSLPVALTDSVVWAGHTLYYAIGSQMWSYNTSTDTSQLVVTASGGDDINNAAVSSDNAYIYLTLTPGNDNSRAHMYRLGLTGRHVPDYVYQLPIILPDTTQPCVLTYINFTQPVVLGASSSDPNQTCTAAITAVFAPYGIGVDELTTRFSQISDGEAS